MSKVRSRPTFATVNTLGLRQGVKKFSVTACPSGKWKVYVPSHHQWTNYANKNYANSWYTLLQVTKGLRFQKDKNVRFISGNFIFALPHARDFTSSKRLSFRMNLLGIAYSCSVILILRKIFICPSGKLSTEFTSPMAKSTSPIAKSTSPGLSDTTFFTRWVCGLITCRNRWAHDNLSLFICESLFVRFLNKV